MELESSRVRLAPPGIPLVSNLTGGWMRPEEATNPAYWTRQLRGTVRFVDGLAQLLAEPPARLPEQAVVSSLRHPRSAEEDDAVLRRAVARLWLAGGDFDWGAFGAAEQRRRVSLPTYPFEPRRYWVDTLPKKQRAARRKPDLKDWTYAPVWKLAPLLAARAASRRGWRGRPWLLLVDRGTDCGALLADRLVATGRRVVRAFAGERFARLNDSTYTPPTSKSCSPASRRHWPTSSIYVCFQPAPIPPPQPIPARLSTAVSTICFSSPKPWARAASPSPPQ